MIAKRDVGVALFDREAQAIAIRPFDAECGDGLIATTACRARKNLARAQENEEADDEP